MNIVICQNELDILRWSLYFHFNSIHLFKMSVIIMKLNLPSFDSRRTLVKWNAFPSSESNQQTKDVLLFTYFFLSMALFSGCKNIQRIVISILLIFLIRLHFFETLCMTEYTICYYKARYHNCEIHKFIQNFIKNIKCIVE